MARDEERAVPFGESLFQGFDRIEVEVVRRLVDNKDFGSCGHSKGELNAPLIPRRELTDRAGPHRGVEDSRTDFADARLPGLGIQAGVTHFGEPLGDEGELPAEVDGAGRIGGRSSASCDPPQER